MSTSEYATVLAWQDALSSGDADTLIKLSSDDIEISSAVGGAQGLVALLDWTAETHTTMTIDQAYVSGSIVVTTGTATGSLTGSAADTVTLAAAFRVVHDQVVSVFIHPDLDSALRATGLKAEDLVRD